MVDRIIKVGSDVKDAVDGLKKVEDSAKKTDRSVRDLGDTVQATAKKFNVTTEEAIKMERAFEKAGFGANRVSDGFQDIPWEKQENNLKKLNKEIDKNSKKLKDQNSTLNQLYSIEEKVTQAHIKSAKAFSMLRDQLAKAEKLLDNYRQIKERLTQSIRKNNAEERAARLALNRSLEEEGVLIKRVYTQLYKYGAVHEGTKKRVLENSAAIKKNKKELESWSNSTREAKAELKEFLSENKKEYNILRKNKETLIEQVGAYDKLQRSTAETINTKVSAMHKEKQYIKLLEREHKVLQRLSKMKDIFERRGQFDKAQEIDRVSSSLYKKSQTTHPDAFMMEGGDGLRFNTRRDMQEFEKGLNSVEKSYKKLNKQVKKGTGILNGWFGKFSIIMSGIAATIFVFQNITRLIGAIAAPLLEIEKAFIKMKIAVGGTVDEFERYRRVSELAARSGYQSTDKNIERLTELREKGYSTAEAMAWLKQETENYSKASEGMYTQKFGKFVSLVKEYSAISFDSLMEHGGLGWALEKVNSLLEDMVNLDFTNHPLIEALLAPGYSGVNEALAELNASSNPSAGTTYKIDSSTGNVLPNDYSMTTSDKNILYKSFENPRIFQKIESIISASQLKIKDEAGSEREFNIKGIDVSSDTKTAEGLLGKHFMKLLSGEKGGFRFRDVGETPSGVLEADAFSKSGFNVADITNQVGIGGSDINIEGTELAGSAIETLRLEYEKLIEFASAREIDLDLINNKDPENMKKAEMVIKEFANTYFDLASLTGKVSIEDFYRAQAKELQTLNERMGKHKDALAESGTMTNQYAKDVESLIKAQNRMNVEAGIDSGIADDISDLQRFEAGLTQTLAHVGTFSEKRVEYEEKAAEESLVIDDQYWAYREQKAKNEAARLITYAKDQVAAEIVISKERIEKLKAQSAAGLLAFGYTNEIKDDTIELLRETAHEEVNIIEQKTGDIYAAMLAGLQKEIEITEMRVAKQKEAFELTGVATEEFVEQQGELIDQWAQYYTERTQDAHAGERYALEEGLNLFKGMYAERLGLYQEFYNATGSMTLDHYAYLKTLAEEESVQMQFKLEMQGFDKKDAKNIAEATKNMRLMNLEVKNLRNSADGANAFAMGLANITEATKSSAEAMYDFGLEINDTFKGTLKDSLEELVKTGGIDAESLFTGIFDNLVSAWSDAMIDMVIATTMKDKAILASEKATAADIIATTQASKASVIATQKATTDAVIALKIYEKELLKSLETEIILNKETGSIIEVSSAQTSADIQIAAAQSVASAQIAASEASTTAVVSGYAAQTVASQSAAAAAKAATASTGWGIAIVAVGLIASQVLSKSGLFGGGSSSGPSREDILAELAYDLEQYTQRLEASNKRLERIAMQDTVSQWLERIKEILDDSNTLLEEIRDNIATQASDAYGQGLYQDYLDDYWTAPDETTGGDGATEPDYSPPDYSYGGGEKDNEPNPYGPPDGGVGVMNVSDPESIYYADDDILVTKNAAPDELISIMTDGDIGGNDGSDVGDDGGYDADFGDPNDGLSDGEGGGPGDYDQEDQPMSYGSFKRMHPEIDALYTDLRWMGLYELMDKLQELYKETGNEAFETLIRAVQGNIDTFEMEMKVLADDILDSVDSFADQWLDTSTKYEADVNEAKTRFLEAGTGIGEAIETYFEAMGPEKLAEYGITQSEMKDLVLNSGTVEGAKALYDKILLMADETGDNMLDMFSETMGSVWETWNDVNDAINATYFERRGDIWSKDISRYWDDLTGVLSGLDQELIGVNDKFDAWHDTLEDLGATTEELNKLEVIRLKALDLTALNYQLEQTEKGEANLKSLIDRMKGVIEDQITKDFTITDWTNIIYRAGDKLDLLDKDTYEDVEKYWEDIIELTTLQLDALENIVSLTEQEISNLETSQNNIQDLLERLQGGDLDPVQSADFFDAKYSALLQGALSPGASSDAIQKFIDFVPEYLDFMNKFGYDYQKMTDVVIGDLGQVSAGVDTTLEDLNNQLISIVGGIGGLGDEFEDVIGPRLDLLLEYAGIDAQNNSVIGDMIGIGFGENGPLKYISNRLIERYLDAQSQTQSIIDAINDQTGDITDAIGGIDFSPEPNDPPVSVDPGAVWTIPEFPDGWEQPDLPSIPTEPSMPTIPDWIPDDGIGVVRDPVIPETNDSLIDKTTTETTAQITPTVPSTTNLSDWEAMQLINFGINPYTTSPYRYAEGGLTKGMSLVGEKGSEWVVPTYDPERTNFLSSINLSPQSLAAEIVNNMPTSSESNEEFTANFEIMIGSEKFGAAMVTAMKKDPEVRKTMKAMVR